MLLCLPGQHDQRRKTDSAHSRRIKDKLIQLPIFVRAFSCNKSEVTRRSIDCPLPAEVFSAHGLKVDHFARGYTLF
jgi:hypothetical protein